ncbi:TetR/AcrR family transcriptional regulator [Thalassorhabdus alkalitolerans]|uniref:TetR/AcrR family transcriptional regulator n=1 Tax=Thalassorhabdus alkalitolerans TaxID=2282697 RepID=A0ABW0YJE5_9BACI
MSPKVGMEPIRRKQVIEAAKACMLSKGFDHFSIKDVAEKAQLSTGVIYHYFKNKQDLYVHVLKDSFGETELMVREAVTKENSYRDKFSAYLEVVAAVPEDNPDFYIILLNYLAQSPYNDDVKQIISKFLINLQGFIEDILQHGVNEGRLTPLEQKTISQMITSQAMGLAFQGMLLPQEERSSVLKDEFIRIFKQYVD